MVTMEQVKSGLSAYIDAEILPRMDGVRRYALTVYLALLMQDFSSKMTDAMRTPAMSLLGVVDDQNHIDIDRLHEAAKNAMSDSLDVAVPVIGRFTFSRADVDKLCEMIRRA